MRNVPESSKLERVRVGEWLVAPALNEISSAGRTVKLEPKVMAVLAFFAQRPGQVVSREEILSAVWPGVVVGDDSVTQAVIKLRKALGDVAEAPTYLQTIAKGGYRLVAPVTRSAEAPPPGRERGKQWMAAAAVAAVMLIAATAWFLRNERASDARPAAIPATEAARATLPTVTIAPFEALGGDPQAVLLAGGLTADLITDLSKVGGLSVVVVAPGQARTGYLVSGSVQRIDKRVRLHIHLTDAHTGKQLWAEKFDRAVGDFFAIQEELAPKILQILPAKVSQAELRRVAQRHTRNLEAYESFQRGQAALLAREKVANESAREMFRRAIALDATFARAYSGLALTHAADYRNQWTVDGAAALGRAFDIARTAHEMNPDIPETYWVLAFVHMERRQHDQALQQLRTAVGLYPSFADGYALMGGVNTYIGRPMETVPLLRTAMRLNPEAGYLYFLLLGRAYLFLGDLEQARVNLEHALARNPANVETHVYMAALHAIAGDKSAAAWQAEEIRALQPGFSARAWLATYPMTDSPQQVKLREALAQLGF